VTGGLPRYRLTADQFRGLGTGYGDESALAVLGSAQFSKRLLLLQWIRTEPAAPGSADAWDLLDSAAEGRPDAVRAVLAHPFVGSWAASHLRAGTSTSTDGGYLVTLAAACAVAAGKDFEVRIPGQSGEVLLPGLGLAYGLGRGPAVIRHHAGTLTIGGPDRSVSVPVLVEGGPDQPYWCPYRTVEVGEAHTVAVDDLDPYRSCFRLTLADRLRPDAYARLRGTVTEAWRLIEASYPEYLPTLRHCLHVLVPLDRAGPGSVSATAHSAFGAIATSLPDDAPGLAHLLIHEAQHLKLGALLDLVDLIDPADRSVYHAPWRADPRPLLALLHGAYAHTGVADFWRIHRHHSIGDAARVARFEFAYWLEQTQRAVDTLARSKGLTEHGVRFVAHLGRTLDGLRDDLVDPALATGVAELATAVAVGWRLRHHRLPDGELADLVRGWRAGDPCPPIAPATVATDPAGGPARLDGIAALLRHELCGTPGAVATDTRTAGLLRDGPAAAAATFRAALAADPDDAEAWAGLALALGRAGATDAARTISERPELVRAMLTRVPDRADPAALADWLSGGFDPAGWAVASRR
jgi:uncharacterized protein